ncbi:MAG: squalene/phytoene synthase family protein [Pseudoxanthomonas sp.]
MSDSAGLDNFLDKWRTRWPEWQVAETFIPAAQRPLVVAWFALLQEFEDIMNVDGDPLPADAKLGWWAQELRDWSQRRSRHPLGRLLEPVQAPWAELAEALPVVQLIRRQPGSLAEAMTQFAPFARVVARIEAALFDAPTPADHAHEAIAAQWLALRAESAGAAAAPVGLALPAWRSQLLSRWPPRPRLSRPRRVWSRLSRLRLAREQAQQRPVAKPLVLLWQSWISASGGR